MLQAIFRGCSRPTAGPRVSPGWGQASPRPSLKGFPKAGSTNEDAWDCSQGPFSSCCAFKHTAIPQQPLHRGSSTRVIYTAHICSQIGREPHEYVHALPSVSGS